MSRMSATALAARLQFIADEAVRRRELKLSPVESSTGFIKREVYALVGKWSGPQSTLRDVLAEAGHLPARASALEGNPYHWVLLAICRCGYPVVHTEMRRIANELKYAHRHAVPVELLVGFLLQTAAANDIYRRVQDDTQFELCMSTYAPTKKQIDKSDEKPPVPRDAPAAKPRHAILKIRNNKPDAAGRKHRSQIASIAKAAGLRRRRARRKRLINQ